MKTCQYAGCGKELSTSYKLKLHVERHHLNIKRFHCRECLKQFKSSDSLKRHQFKHRNTEERGERAGTVVPVQGEMQIPKLTAMVKMCRDQDLRPNAHVEYVFPFPHDDSKPILPPILL